MDNNKVVKASEKALNHRWICLIFNNMDTGTYMEPNK